MLLAEKNTKSKYRILNYGCIIKTYSFQKFKNEEEIKEFIAVERDAIVKKIEENQENYAITTSFAETYWM